jgi:hypothetical protein
MSSKNPLGTYVIKESYGLHIRATKNPDDLERILKFHKELISVYNMEP